MFSFSALFNRSISQETLQCEFKLFFGLTDEQVYICSEEDKAYLFAEKSVVFNIELLKRNTLFGNIMNVDFRLNNMTINHAAFLVELCKHNQCECYFEDDNIQSADPYLYQYISGNFSIEQKIIPYQYVD